MIEICEGEMTWLDMCLVLISHVCVDMVLDSWPVINKLACEILPNNVVEIVIMKYFVRNCVSTRLFLHRPTLLNHFLLLVVLAYLHFQERSRRISMHDIGLRNSEDKYIRPIANKDEEKKKTH